MKIYTGRGTPPHLRHIAAAQLGAGGIIQQYLFYPNRCRIGQTTFILLDFTALPVIKKYIQAAAQPAHLRHILAAQSGSGSIIWPYLFHTNRCRIGQTTFILLYFTALPVYKNIYRPRHMVLACGISLWPHRWANPVPLALFGHVYFIQICKESTEIHSHYGFSQCWRDVQIY